MILMGYTMPRRDALHASRREWYCMRSDGNGIAYIPAGKELHDMEKCPIPMCIAGNNKCNAERRTA
ncbi:hypothetical protein PEDI_20360 [Persicobacter diffluens]|uniref:Uncharacterized protein n=1 Tax=Persicobacter diffluens TaxID=981 RepID=A0AAN4VWN9_9BACT|nr:hypothetical protein PEDI_20360 [Persicobacter diffluens]